jgi:hypothetical protein
MATPRVGALGVGTTKGDLYVVNDVLDLERVPVGTDDQVLVADSSVAIGVAWKDPSFSQKVSFMADAVAAIFKKIDLGAGAINNPQAKTRGTHSILAYDDTTVEGVAWQLYIPYGYDGGTLRLHVYWAAATAVAGDVIWAGAYERDNVAALDINTDDFAALQTAAASTAPGTAGVLQVATINFTQAQADGVVGGDAARLFLQRTASAVGDTMDGDAQIVRIVIEEV